MPTVWPSTAVPTAARCCPGSECYLYLVVDVAPDLSVFAYVLILSLSAGLLFGLPPALTNTRSALFAISRNTSGSSGRSRLRHRLIATQVAVSLTLLIAGGLLVRSAIQAITMATGYDVDRVVGVTLEFSGQTDTAGARAALASDFRNRLAAVAGVTTITSGRAPSDMRGARSAAVSLNGQAPSEHNTRGTIYYTWVGSTYFETLGIPLITGTAFAVPVEQAHVAIVSEAAARTFWPAQDPIGQTLRLATTGRFHATGELVPDGPTWQVIGVARDTRGVTMDRSDTQQVYLPLPADRVQDYPILRRTSVDPDLVVRRLEQVAAKVDPALTVSATTLRTMLRGTFAFLAASMSAAIATSIGLCGLLLASIGIYGAVSYDVVLRTREVGIRMAIGAQKRDILAVVMRGSLRAVFGGLLIGMVLAVGAARVLRGVLYGLGSIDAISFGAASLLFLTIALVASWVPSRRAMRIDPLVALREQ